MSALAKPVRANGQLGAAAYHRRDDDAYEPFALVVLACTRTHLSRISLFADPTLFERLGLPVAVAAE